MGKLLILTPFHLLAALLYVGAATAMGNDWLAYVESDLTLPSGRRIVFDGETLMIMLTVVLLMFESIKSVMTGWASITNHILSAVLFIAAFGALITLPLFGTTAWMIITLTMFADMMIGVVVTTIAARRDLDVR
jgi:hypothetical protein